MRLKKSKFIELKSKNKIILILLLIFCITIFLLIRFNKSIKPILINYADNVTMTKAKGIINMSIKESITEKVNTNELLKTIKNSKDEIISIDFDSYNINMFLVEITDKLLINMKNLEKESFENIKNIYTIPVGIMTKMPSINWVGPKIPIKTYMMGTIDTNISTDLKEYGINNVLMSVNIVVSTEVQVMLPYVTKKNKILVEIPIASKIIQGSIPTVYGGLYSSSSNIHSESLSKN